MEEHVSTLEVTTFQMKTLTPVAKVWYNFMCAKLRPNLHLSMVIKDKTILLYVITQGIKFNVGHVIERGIIELTHGSCTGALIHPFSSPSFAEMQKYR